MKRLFPLLLLLSVPAGPCAIRAAEAMETRAYSGAYGPNLIKFIHPNNEPARAARAARASADTEARDFKAQLWEMGVEFPAGSAVCTDSALYRVVMRNTAVNHRRLAGLLAAHVPSQVEIDVAFVSFPPDEIEKAAREQDAAVPSTDQLKGLWRQGRGRLLAATKTLTRSGVNAQVKGVEEIVYPTKFTGEGGGSASNAAPRTALVPDGFETRETGAIVNVTPTVGYDGRTIDLTIVPEFCDEGEPAEINVAVRDAKGAARELALWQPRFHSRNATTSVVLMDGATVVLGGLPNREGDEWTYLFISARILDARAVPLAEVEGELLEGDDAAAAIPAAAEQTKGQP